MPSGFNETRGKDLGASEENGHLYSNTNVGQNTPGPYRYSTEPRSVRLFHLISFWGNPNCRK